MYSVVSRWWCGAGIPTGQVSDNKHAAAACLLAFAGLAVCMREAASCPHRILTSPAPNVLILSFGESAIELEVRFWIADAQHGVHNVKSEVLYEVWRLFRREGIQIPYPSGICMFVPLRRIEIIGYWAAKRAVR